MRCPVPHCQRLASFAPTSPSRRARLASLLMPAMNSAEKPSTISAGTPRARSPSQVSATCSAVSGGGSSATALLTGACASHARAASRSLTRSSRKQACVWCLYPKRTSP